MERSSLLDGDVLVKAILLQEAAYMKGRSPPRTQKLSRCWEGHGKGVRNDDTTGWAGPWLILWQHGKLEDHCGERIGG